MIDPTDAQSDKTGSLLEICTSDWFIENHGAELVNRAISAGAITLTRPNGDG